MSLSNLFMKPFSPKTFFKFGLQGQVLPSSLPLPEQHARCRKVLWSRTAAPERVTCLADAACLTFTRPVDEVG